jgi:hypothetical protein
MKSVCKVLIKNLEGRDHSGESGEGRVMIKWILKEFVYEGVDWIREALKRVHSGGLL